MGESSHKDNIGLDSSTGVNIVVTGVIGGVSLFETYGYGHANKDTFELIDRAQLYDASLNDPEKRLSRGVFSDAVPPEKNAQLLQYWQEARAGLEQEGATGRAER